MENFRENYHDIAIDHMNGRIYYKNSDGKIVLDFFDFSVKTSIIPDEVDGKNQFLYNFFPLDYAESFSQPIIFDDDLYKDIFNGVNDKSTDFKLSYKEKNIIEDWLNNPSKEIDWLKLRNAVLLLSKSEGLSERNYAKDLLNRILLVETEINVGEEYSLPGFMSPLNMVKSAASATLKYLDSTEGISKSILYNSFFLNFLENHQKLFPILRILLNQLIQ